SYRGLPYDLLEDLLPHSGAWKQVMPFLAPYEDVATGRPITPLHGGHVGLLCTAGLLNGVFGQGDNRHIARWRSVTLLDSPRWQRILSEGARPQRLLWASTGTK